ncbi:glutathione S-transferase family protein [Novosphingopyxis sp.]|uniref:glutathione S-transferase family protein n=1 Tax=Novosphingopyxis sp. TaxID=2709690 RepID=UPI003B597A37
MADIDYYTNPMSRGQIARWALHEAGADYEQHILDYGGTMKGNDYLAINPMGKVPAIVRGKDVVTECAAICAYLADAYPDAELAPEAGETADYYRWMFFAAGPVEQAIVANSMGWSVPDDKQAMVGFGSYERVVDVLDQQLQGRDHVCGDRFTMADVYFGSQIIWGQEFGGLPKRDSFERYAKRLTERPAYQAAKAIDNALIVEMQGEGG